MFRPFPNDLENQLHPLPDYYLQGSIANDILIVNVLSHRAVDIVHHFIGAEL